MYRTPKYALISLIYIALFISFLQSNSRIAYSRPSSYMRTPSAIAGDVFNNFYIGLGTEIINTTNLNYSRTIYFYSTTTSGFDYGLNYVTHADSSTADSGPPSEFLFHFTKDIYHYNNLIINLGVHDITIMSDLEKYKPSLFLSFINDNIRIKENYLLQAAVGLGSGYINSDPHDHTTPSDHANVFFALKFATPWRKIYNNSVNVFLEYIDGGLHTGFDMPINKSIKFQFGLTHIENISDLNTYKTDNEELIFGDDTGIAISFQYQIPTKKNDLTLLQDDLENVSIAAPEDNCYLGFIQEEYNNPLQINEGCAVNAINQIVKEVNKSFQNMKDSLLTLTQVVTSYDLTNNALEIKLLATEDSLKQTLLDHIISSSETNIAIKSFTNSLKYYYSNEYHLALKELNKTIKYLPNLAGAYARRGSIYYKLGEIDQATINWNYALMLDPEYKEVQDILLYIKGNTNNNIDLPE